MKRLILFILVFTLILVGCSPAQDTADEGKINIVASFFPVYDLVAGVGGDKVNVVNLTQSGDAHSFEPSIQDMERISKSDLLVINGAGFEGWIDQVKQSQKDLNILDLSEGLDLIYVKDLPGGENADPNDVDPHTWLSIENPPHMLEKIYNELSSMDPDNSDYYKANYEAYVKEFEGIKSQYDSTLPQYAGRAFVAPHAAFNYLVNDYNLEQVAIEGMNSVQEPNAGRMREVVDLMREKNIDTVFYEFGQSDKVAKSIANEIGGQVLPISTLEVITQEDVDNGVDYIGLLKMNLENLVKSFE